MLFTKSLHVLKVIISNWLLYDVILINWMIYKRQHQIKLICKLLTLKSTQNLMPRNKRVATFLFLFWTNKKALTSFLLNNNNAEYSYKHVV